MVKVRSVPSVGLRIASKAMMALHTIHISSSHAGSPKRCSAKRQRASISRFVETLTHYCASVCELFGRLHNSRALARVSVLFVSLHEPLLLAL